MTQQLDFPKAIETIAGVAITQLARQFGTPLYVYDAAMITRRLGELATFDVVRYAQKACSNLAILRLVRQHGGLVDCVSAWEIRRALAAGFQAGAEPAQIVYTADVFDAESLDLVVAENIDVNCGSPDMIDQLGARASGRGIKLRINPGFGHGHSQKTNTGGEQSKHGIWHEQIGECLTRAAANGLTIDGLHMHIGSGTDMRHLSQVCAAMEKAATEVGPSLKMISAGGGLPVPYRGGEERVDINAYFHLWNDTRQRLQQKFDHAVSLEIEPGRYISAESGYLLAEIRATKTMGDKRYYLVDAGFNNLARPILYGAYQPMAIAAGENKPAVTDRSLMDVVVGGPLCESGDIFTQQEGGFVETRKLPDADVGDYLVIQNAGAYGFCMSSNYNSKPLAAEMLIENGTPRLIRRRQTFDDYIRDEQL